MTRAQLDAIAQFHVHRCETCNLRVGCSSAQCDRAHATLDHPAHEVPERASLHRGSLTNHLSGLPEIRRQVSEPAEIFCEVCLGKSQLDTVLGRSGRQVSVYCHACQGRSILTFPICLECGATRDEKHDETCSFATPWGV